MRELTVLQRLRDVATEQVGSEPSKCGEYAGGARRGHESSDSRFVHAVLEYARAARARFANVQRAPTCPGERAGLANGLAARLAASRLGSGTSARLANLPSRHQARKYLRQVRTRPVLRAPQAVRLRLCVRDGGLPRA